MLKGIAVSPGVMVGQAYCIHEIFVNPETKRLEEGEISQQLASFEVARDQTADDLRALRLKVEKQVGHREAAIFSVQESILQDQAFGEKILHGIREDRLTVQGALHQLMQEYTTLFAQTEDSYLKERVNDVRDVVIRISSHLSDVLKSDSPALEGPLVLVADELLPSHVVALEDADVRAIVTQAGSQTSHAAILARSRGIPAVCGVSRILAQVNTGDTVIVDGREGHVLVKPDAETRSAYAKLEREFIDLQDRLATNRDQQAISADGIELELLANINGQEDARIAKAMGASGIGLFRTEYLYLAHPDVPDEEEQLQHYQRVIAESPGDKITIRTLDIGGDKTVPYLGHTHQEANPFLGWRSIRLSFEHPEFFASQLRAVFRASILAEESGKELRLMFPMITTLEEMHRVRGMVRRARQELVDAGEKVGKVLIGMMLEVPAAAVSIDSILHAVDFVSIGSNDLIQYLMAADRDNPKVSHLCQPLAPPVLRLLDNVIRVCRDHNTPITLCGEMAGQPRAFVLLFAMGLRSFSMSPAFIPSIKELAGRITAAQAESILEHALKLRTTTNVKRFMAARLRQIAPSLTLMDTN
ncbi:MAG: phosphoenolpyruvate--protein phosphotransferase [Planctomycetaceae bacterium]|nr:phosphoenolpyruvate--protein phosphotransferase [Planctomycetaceae bacterium]